MADENLRTAAPEHAAAPQTGAAPKHAAAPQAVSAAAVSSAASGEGSCEAAPQHARAGRPESGRIPVTYICKYTPVELMVGLGLDPVPFDTMVDDFSEADEWIGSSVCGFGKTILTRVLSGDVRNLVLVNCCDTIRSVYDVIEAEGLASYVCLLDMLHGADVCSCEQVASDLVAFAHQVEERFGTAFDEAAFRTAFHAPERVEGPFVSVLGGRMSSQTFEQVASMVPVTLRNDTCLAGRSVGSEMPPEGVDFGELMVWYARQLLGQMPCMRMHDTTARRRLFNDPDLVGIVYHTVRFCDFYSFEYADVKDHANVPVVKIESDFTAQSSGQLATRIQAFAENLTGPVALSANERLANAGGDHGAGGNDDAAGNDGADGADDENGTNGEPTGRAAEAGREGRNRMGKGYFAGIDSGSTSTDCVIVDTAGAIVATAIVNTGAGATGSARKVLDQALQSAGLRREDVSAVVSTGYGRTAIATGADSVTEITCHARGARAIDPEVRTVIDIGGQDSKVIKIADDGRVENFAMNDKCAAGTGRFLEMMARTLEMDLDDMARRGLTHRENITISSTCSVFAESEVVSLIAQDKDVDDIVWALNRAVAGKTASLYRRVHGAGPCMMTGGVSKNRGVVMALEETLGEPLIVDGKAQLCGALGAALFARDQAILY